VLLELDFIADCCVVGAPNEEWGEEVCAVLQLEEGTAPDDVAERVRAHCRERLASYQVPRAVDIDPALPRTETGKLARRTIRTRYWEGHERRV
jgi:long-chain acyl-CoA synthetase